MITNILLVSILLVLLSAICAFAFVCYRVWRTALDFITPTEEGKPSALAVAVDSASIFLARALLAQAKGFLMGLQSGQSRSEKSVQADLVEGLASQNPLTALLMSFPALKKSIRRNPALLDVALSALANKAGAGGSLVNLSDNKGNGNQQVKFKL